MARYEVILRSKGDGWMPGDILVDPERADILIKRGFIRKLDENIQTQITEADDKAKGQPMSYQAAIDYGYSEKAAAAVSKGNDPKYVQEETAKLKARDEHRASRPEAEALSIAMDTHIDEVYDLSDDDYKNGVEAFLNTAPDPTDAEEGKEPETTPAEDITASISSLSDEELDATIEAEGLEVAEPGDHDAKVAAVITHALTTLGPAPKAPEA